MDFLRKKKRDEILGWKRKRLLQLVLKKTSFDQLIVLTERTMN